MVTAALPTSAAAQGGPLDAEPDAGPDASVEEPEIEPRPEVEADALIDPLVTPDPLAPLLNPLRDARGEVEDATGLTFSLGYTLVYQLATDTFEDQPSLLTGSYDVAVAWSLIEREGAWFSSTTAAALLEGGTVLDHRDDEDLSANIDSGLGVNDDLDNNDAVLSELWIAQGFADGRAVLTLGKIDQTVFFDSNRIANDETVQFLATPLVNNPSVAFPDNGLGANLFVEPHGSVYVTAGLGSGSADARETTLNNLDGDEVFYAAEVGFTPEVRGIPGGYRVLAWRADSDEAGDVWGVAVSLDQEVGEFEGGKVVPFFRYGYAEPDEGDATHFVSGGVGWESPLGRRGDLLALGGAYLDTDDGHEGLIECFYRLQLTDTLAVTPDAQLILDPIAGGDDVVAVLGCRVQFAF